MTKYVVVCTRLWKIVDNIEAATYTAAVKLAQEKYGKDIAVVYDECEIPGLCFPS